MDGLAIDQLRFQCRELRRIQKDLDGDSQAYENLNDAIQSIDEAIDDSDGVEANTTVEDWK